MKETRLPDKRKLTHLTRLLPDKGSYRRMVCKLSSVALCPVPVQKKVWSGMVRSEKLVKKRNFWMSFRSTHQNERGGYERQQNNAHKWKDIPDLLG